jgi:hypothetical protein
MRILLVALVLGTALAASAQQRKRVIAPVPKGPPCSSTAYHQFDFWVGDWDVMTAKGTPAGENKVEKILDGCALRESWKSADGSHATSLTTYDAPASRWTQTFVDDLGMVLVLEGDFKDGRMVLSGQRSGPRGTSILNRVVWQKLEGDRIRQRWEQSPDEGRQWTVLFEGVYSRKKS